MITADNLGEISFAPATGKGTLPGKPETRPFSQFGPASLENALDVDVASLTEKREAKFHNDILKALAGLNLPEAINITLETDKGDHGILSVAATRGQLIVKDNTSQAYEFKITPELEPEQLAESLVKRLLAQESAQQTEIQSLEVEQIDTSLLIATLSGQEFGGLKAKETFVHVFSIEVFDNMQKATVTRESIAGTFDVSQALRSVN